MWLDVAIFVVAVATSVVHVGMCVAACYVIFREVFQQGRERKRWEDNIREWTGLEFGKSQRQWRTGEIRRHWY